MGNGNEQMFQFLLLVKCHEDRSLTTDLATWWSLMILLGVLHFSAVLKVRSLHDLSGLGLRVNRKRAIGSNK